MWRRRIFIWFRLALVITIYVTFVAPEWPAFEEEQFQLNKLVGLREFDFLLWEADALTVKGVGQLGAGDDYLDEEVRKQTVLTYLEFVGNVRQLRAEINAIYANPDVENPDVASATLQEELATSRLEMERLQPLAEGIIQQQVADILADEGISIVGKVWPPVQMHMTPLPLVLIVSPRERIERIYGIPLVHGLTTPEQEALETAVFTELDRSALVVPIGGLGMFPAMIVETGNINALADVVAHEWTHHWLTFYPLGIRYGASPALRTMNETVASIVGQEVGARVVARFYPEFVPAPPESSTADSTAPEAEALFDFRAEMAETRIRVDELLAAGEVKAAEAYMEERRQFFVSHGFPIRKLNQAYFAFYGAYAEAPGATGADPVGPAVVALRAQSSSLVDFMRTVGRITSFEELEEVVAR